MADHFYVVKATQVDGPEQDMAQIRRVAFVRKLGERAQLRASDGQLYMFLQAPQTLQQMRMAVSGKLNALGFQARICQVSEEDFAQQLVAASHTSGTPGTSSLPSDSSASAAASAAMGTMARRTSLQTVMDLLPTLSRFERSTVLFKIVALDVPPVETWEQKLVKTKEDMAKIVRDHPIGEWGEQLAPFVQEANRQDPQRPKCPWDATLDGLHLLLGYPSHDCGFKRTRNTSLDPPIRVVNVFKKPFPVLSMPERFPAAPPPNVATHFIVELVVKDLHGDESPRMRISCANFAENASWKASFHGGGPEDAKLWASTQARWLYGFASIYDFAAVELQKQREMHELETRSASVDFTRADQIAKAAEEAERRRRGGPLTIHVPAESDEGADKEDWSEEFAELRETLAKRRRTESPLGTAQMLWMRPSSSGSGARGQ